VFRLTGPGWGVALHEAVATVSLADATDTDDDGLLDGADDCDTVADPAQVDSDGDGVGDVCDNSPLCNPDQADADDDGIGDVSDCAPNDPTNATPGQASNLQYTTPGDKSTFTATSGRLSIRPPFTIEPGVTLNRVTVRQGAFTQRLITSRVTYTMTPLMFASALVQYNSATGSVSTNARLRWEYQPGSELFVVYNEDRNTSSLGVQGLSTRSIIVKVNRLFRY